MAEKRRDSDLSSELYFSVYGNNRKLPPQKIKVYVLYKPLLESITANNFVVAASEKNEIFISFKEGSESKLFNFDKVFYSDISQDDFYLLNKSAIQDVIMGVNSFLILCKLSSPPQVKSSFKMDFSSNIMVNVLKELLFFINKEENKACSLHVSYFEMHGSKLLDHLSKFKESKDIQIYENPEKDNIEIKGLIEKPVTSDKDIDELLKIKLLSSECNATCCHSIVIISLVKRNISVDGFEFIKNGKLTLVSPAQCKGFETKGPNTDDCLMHLTEKSKFPSSSNSMMLNILKFAFQEKVTTTVIIFLSSILCSLKKDLEMLQFSSTTHNHYTHPEMDLQLIIRNSTKEYADEIKELQKDLDATSEGNGVRIDHLLYRSINNTLVLENEKVKNLSSQMFGLTDTISCKKQEIINFQKTFELKEMEVKEVETSIQTLKIGLEEIENMNITEKIPLKAGEIINLKQMIVSEEQCIKDLKLQLKESIRNYEELVRSIHFLKNETLSFVCDIDAQNTSQRSSLELLIVAMNNAFSEFQHLEKDLMLKFNNMVDIDVLIRSWKKYMETLKSNISSFIHNNHQCFTSIKLEVNFATFQCASRESEEDIKCSLDRKIAVFLEYYFSKLQVFCNHSFKLLSEIIYQMDVIENYYKAEFKAMFTAFGSVNEAFEKFICDINLALKSFKQHFAEQEELSRMMEIINFHQKFKKQFGEKINAIKKSLLDLRQIYLNYNDASSNKWNEIQKSCQKTIQKYNGLSDHLILLQKEKWPQQKINTLEYSSLKEKTDFIENHIVQLLQIHKEMKGNLEEAFADHKKGTDEQFSEMKKFTNFRKTEIEKYFNVLSVNLKASASSFFDYLKSIHKDSSNIEDTFKRDLDSLSSVSLFEPIYDNYLSTSSTILARSEQTLKIAHFVTEDKKDSIPDFENLFLEEWKVTTSTPNIPKTKKINVSEEKDKLLSRIQSLAAQQTFQKSNISILDYEEKEINVSTVSLPVLKTQSKILLFSEKSFPRLKSRKK